MQSSNVLLAGDGTAKVADVGLAQALLSKTHLSTTTVRYIISLLAQSARKHYSMPMASGSSKTRKFVAQMFVYALTVCCVQQLARVQKS